MAEVSKLQMEIMWKMNYNSQKCTGAGGMKIMHKFDKLLHKQLSVESTQFTNSAHTCLMFWIGNSVGCIRITLF